MYVSTFICVDDLAGDVSIADPHDCDHIQFKYNDIWLAVLSKLCFQRGGKYQSLTHSGYFKYNFENPDLSTKKAPFSKPYVSFISKAKFFKEK